VKDISEIIETYKTCKEIVEDKRESIDNIEKIIEILKNLQNIRIDVETKKALKETCLKAIIILYTKGKINQQDLLQIGLSKDDIDFLTELIELEKYLKTETVEIRQIIHKIKNIYLRRNNLKNNIITEEKFSKIVREILKKIIDKLSNNDIMKIINLIESLYIEDSEKVYRKIIKEKMFISKFIDVLRTFSEEFREELYKDIPIFYVRFLRSKYRIIILFSNLDLGKIYEVPRPASYVDIIITTLCSTLPYNNYDYKSCLISLDLENCKIYYNCLTDIAMLLESLLKRDHMRELYDKLRNFLLSIIREKSSNPISRRFICYLSAREVIDLLYSKFNILSSLYDILILFYELSRDNIGEIRPIEDDFYLIVRRSPYGERYC